MRRSTLLGLAVLLVLVSGLGWTQDAPAVLEHTPPVQVYQGLPFRIMAKPLIPLQSLAVQLNMAELEISLPMQKQGYRYAIEVPAKATRKRRGTISYHFEAVDASGRTLKVYGQGKAGFKTKLVPPPAAVLLNPLGGKLVTETFTVIIGLNEAFAVVPAESFKITFDGMDVSKEAAHAPNRIGFVAGPGLHNGVHTVKLETADLPGWRVFTRSWSFSLRKEEPVPGDREGPLTLSLLTASEGQELGTPDYDNDVPGAFAISWDGRLLSIDGGFITPALSPLTAGDPTPLEERDYSLLGVQSRLELGRVSAGLVVGESEAGRDHEAYPQITMGFACNLGALGLNLAAVYDDQTFTPAPTEPPRQSYVASLLYGFGSDDYSRAGGALEIASAVSFDNAYAEIDWALVESAAGLEKLANLRPLLEGFPLPYVDPLDEDTWPLFGSGVRLAAWGPVGSSLCKLELSYVDDDFLSLGSPVYHGTTAVLMIALDPERDATAPFSYDPGIVAIQPETTESTYGVHLTGVSFKLAGDPVRLGFDYFVTNWDPEKGLLLGAIERVRNLRIAAGYYTYLDLNAVFETGLYTNQDGNELNFLSLEAEGTRRIGHFTLGFTAGWHKIADLAVETTDGLAIKVRYDGNLGNLGLSAFFEAEYGDPYFYNTEEEVKWLLGTSLNF